MNLADNVGVVAHDLHNKLRKAGIITRCMREAAAFWVLVEDSIEKLAGIFMQAAKCGEDEGREEAALGLCNGDVFCLLGSCSIVAGSEMVARVSDNEGGREGINAANVKDDRRIEVDDSVWALDVDVVAAMINCAKAGRSLLGVDAERTAEAEDVVEDTIMHGIAAFLAFALAVNGMEGISAQVDASAVSDFFLPF